MVGFDNENGMIRAGSVIKSKAYPYHYFIVLSDPDTDGKVLIAVCTDAANYPYEQVRLHVEDHSFVTKETALVVPNCRPVDLDLIPRYFDVRYEPLCPEVLGRIQRAVKKSRRLSPIYKEYLPG